MRKRRKRAIIYGLRVKGEAEYFYIGSTERDPQVRLRAHLYSQKDKANPFLVSRIGTAGRSNIEIEVIEEVASSRRFKREYQVMNAHKERGVDLCNLKYSEKIPDWLRFRNEQENRQLVIILENHLDRDPSNFGASLFERIFDAQIVRLKMDCTEENTSPELLKRIQALPWPQSQPIFPSRSEFKKAFDSINLPLHARKEIYGATEILRRRKG